jgi:membrane protease YdiL (CAAX protease family)
VIAEAVRWLAPPLAAAATAALFDRGLAREPSGALPPGLEHPLRRLAAGALLAALLYLSLFAPLALPPDLAVPADFSAVAPWRLFLMHAVLLAGLAAWTALAWLRQPRAPEPVPEPVEVPAPPETAAVPPPPGAGALAFLRLSAADPRLEIALGLAAGLGIWAAALALGSLVVWGLTASGGADLVPAQAPRLIAFVAGQPAWLRLAVSLSAGGVEELFFRGFLQPRLGIGFTTVLFVLAHAAYGSPVMLVSVAFLSVVYGGLARWRGSVWAAAAAHALFDAVQLLVVLPMALELAGESAPVPVPIP